MQYYCYAVFMQVKATINDRGVITIPAALRQLLGLKANDEVILEDTGGGILMRPAISVPLEVYTEERIQEFARDDAAIGAHLPKRRRT
jgi:AbrB family looped-hinge helix DNA binding protein